MTGRDKVIGAVGVAAALWCFAGAPLPSSDTTPAPAAVSPDLQKAASPVTASLAGHPALATILAGVFERGAAAIEATPDLIKTTADVRNLALYSTRTVVTTDGEPIPAAFLTARDAVMDAAVGTREQIALTAETRKKAADGFRAIAYGCREAK